LTNRDVRPSDLRARASRSLTHAQPPVKESGRSSVPNQMPPSWSLVFSVKM
jgi:hypothetical protein